MKNQRTATVDALLSVTNYEINNGETDLIDEITTEQRNEVKSILFNMFRAKEVSYRPEFQAKVDDDKELKSYIGGLVNNWIRKAKELNNGEVYQPKNPGSRAGSGNPEVRELKKLLKKVKGTEHEAKVQAVLDQKISEIAPKAVAINAELIPEEFQDLLS